MLRQRPKADASAPTARAAAAPRNENVATLRVLSFSMSMLPLGHGQGEHHKDERLADFADRCDTYDVLVLQEVYASTLVPSILQGACCKQRKLITLLRSRGFVHYALPRQPSYAAMLKQGTAFADAGLVILSRLPIVSRGFQPLGPRSCHSLSPSAQRCLSSNKGVVFAKIQVSPTNAVLVFNVHLQSLVGVGLSEADQRTIIAAQGSELRELLEFVAQEHGHCPLIVAGDFNANAIDPHQQPQQQPPPQQQHQQQHPQQQQQQQQPHHLHSRRVCSAAVRDGADGGQPHGSHRGRSGAAADPTGRRLGRAAWQLRVLLNTLDPERKFVELVSAAAGCHPPTRPPSLEYPSSLHALATYTYPTRADYIFFRPAPQRRRSHPPNASGTATPRPFLAPVSGSVRVEKFVGGAGAPYRYISDHYGVSAEFGLAASSTLGGRSHTSGSNYVREGEATCDGARAPFVARTLLTEAIRCSSASDAAAEPCGQERDRRAVGRRRAQLEAFMAAASGPEAAALLQPSVIAEVLLLPTVLIQLWLVPWLRLVLLLVSLVMAAKALFGNQVLTINAERRFARVTPETTLGQAPVHLLHETGVQDPTAALAADSIPAEFARTVDLFGWRQCFLSRTPMLQPPPTHTMATSPVSYLSFKDLDVAVSRIVANMRQMTGLQRADCVGIFAEWTPLCCAIDLACMKLGIVTVPLAGDSKLVRHVIDETGARVVFCTHQNAARVLLSRSRVLCEVLQLDGIDDEERELALETGVRLTVAQRLLAEHWPSTPALSSVGGDDGGIAVSPTHSTGASFAPTDSADVEDQRNDGPRPQDVATVVFAHDDQHRVPPGTTNLHAATLQLVRKTHAQMHEEVRLLRDARVVQQSAAAAFSTDPAALTTAGFRGISEFASFATVDGSSPLHSSSSSNSGSGGGSGSSSCGVIEPERLLVMAPYHSYCDRLLLYAFLLGGHQIASGAFMSDFAAFAPTVVAMNAASFQLLFSQFQQFRLRWRAPYRWLFDRIYSFRSRLIRLGRDSKSLRWLFCNQFRQQLGGNVRRVLLLSNTATSPFELREFVAVCYAPLMREIVFRATMGTVSIDGIPAPRRLTRLAQLPDSEELTPALAPLLGSHAAMDAEGLGVLEQRLRLEHDGRNVQSAPATPCDTDDWKSTGLVAKWRGAHLQVLCPLDALLWPASTAATARSTDAARVAPTAVSALEVERAYRAALSNLAFNLFITCRFGHPLVAIIAPVRDVLEDWVNDSTFRSELQQQQQRSSASGTATWPQLVALATPALLQFLRHVHTQRGLPPAMRVEHVHLHPHPFAQHSDFIGFSQHHRRCRINLYFSKVVARMYEGAAAAAGGPSAGGAASPTTAAGGSPQFPPSPHVGTDSATPLQKPTNPPGPPLISIGAALPSSSVALQSGSSPVSPVSPALHSRKRQQVNPTAATEGNKSDPLLHFPPCAPEPPAGGQSASASPRGEPFGNALRAVQTDCEDGVRLSFVAPVAVDIGGTCCKVVFFRPPDAPSSLPDYCQIDDSHDFERVIALDQVASVFFPGATKSGTTSMGFGSGSTVLRFAKMPSARVPDFIEFVVRSGVHALFRKEALERVPATGGGAYKFGRLVGERLGVTLEPHKEMDGIIKGLNFLLQYVSQSIFTFDLELDEQRPHRLNGVGGSAPRSPFAPTASTASETALRAGSPAASAFPYIVVNIGSGVSIVKCLSGDGSYVRVGGSPIGGATFWGLVRALTSIRTWEEVHEMTRVDGPGDNTNVDLLVGDIYGFGAVNLPQRLTVDTVASTFGKLGTGKFFRAEGSVVAQAPGPCGVAGGPHCAALSGAASTAAIGTVSSSSTGRGIVSADVAALGHDRPHGLSPSNAPALLNFASLGGVEELPAESALGASMSAFASSTSGPAGGIQHHQRHRSFAPLSPSTPGPLSGDGDGGDMTGPGHATPPFLAPTDVSGADDDDDGRRFAAATAADGVRDAGGRELRGSAAASTSVGSGGDRAAAAVATGVAPRAVDVVRSLLIMIANNVTQLAYLTCRTEGVRNVFFTGGFVRDNPLVWKQITRSLAYWTNGSISAHFLVHDGYLGALGSLLDVSVQGEAQSPQ